MTISISIDEVQRNLLVFLERVQEGETVVIMKGGQPVAEVRPVVVAPSRPRPCGLCAGEFEVPDGFDAPLPEEVLREFERP
jgi:antitoxin (DNA-binding transcriptional repressor) of toxin-antitoxin stability system